MTRSVVITGGNRGIGRAITSEFVKAGYHVIVGARKSENIESIDPDRVSFFAMDVRDEDVHIALAEKAISIAGNLDVWVNNAGISSWRPITAIDEKFFDELMNINLKGAFWGCKAAAQNMPNGGAIINISSIAGKRGSANNAMYCATKFGVNGLTQSLCKELGPSNIRVNALCPVLIETNGLAEALAEEYAPGVNGTSEFLSNFRIVNAALGRLPTGEDVANMAVFLASDAANGITGQCINIDCGVFPQ